MNVKYKFKKKTPTCNTSSSNIISCLFLDSVEIIRNRATAAEANCGKIFTKNQLKIYCSRLWFHLQLVHHVVASPVKLCIAKVHMFRHSQNQQIFLKKYSNSLRLSKCVFSTSFFCFSILAFILRMHLWTEGKTRKT